MNFLKKLIEYQHKKNKKQKELPIIDFHKTPVQVF